MNLTVMKCDKEGQLVDSDGPPSRRKLSVARNLGRIEQIFACATRILSRPEEQQLPADVQVEVKKA